MPNPTEWPAETVTAGCGVTGPLAETCNAHVRRVDFDGFTVDWHAAVKPGRRAMWRNGRPIRAHR